MFAISRGTRRARLLGPLNDNAVALGDTLHGLGKRQVIVLHQKIKNTATRLAAETVINALFLAHRKRGRFFAVERTKAHMVWRGCLRCRVIGARLVERRAPPD